MKNIFIFIAVFGFLMSYNNVLANENVSLEEMAFELEQLKNAFRKMEQDNKARILAMEEQLKRQKTEQDYKSRIGKMEHDYKTKIRTLEELLGKQKIELEQDYKARIRTLEELLEEEMVYTQEAYARRTESEKIRPFYGTKGSLMNPDISILADTFYHFSDQKGGVGEFSDEDLFIREVEMAIQGYIYPGVRAEFFPAWEVESGHVEIEEAFANFLTLPFNSSLLVGRHRIRFGLVNPTHQHFRDYVDTPLTVQNFLGSHAYIDDGVDFSVMIPNISIPVTVGLGVFDGDKSLVKHEHQEKEHTSDIFKSKPVEFSDHVFLGKLNANIPLSDDSDISLGYHVLWDGNGAGNTAIHNGQLSFRYRFPYSYRKLLWQNEVYIADIDNRKVNSIGYYSLINFNLNRYLDAGFRYDWSELGDNDDAHHWAVNPILTWHMTEASYVRAQYRYGELEDSTSGDKSVNEVILQFVWGMGPHSHKLKD